jgi:hypothetical protein
MNKKVWMLVAAAIVLAAASIYFNRDWFAKDHIQIFDRSRPARGPLASRRFAGNPEINPIVFGFDRDLRLTSLKVIPVSDIETNKYPHPLWQLITESNSVPIKEFGYDARIRGMHPAVKGDKADPLQPGVKYRLYIEAGSEKAEHDFVPVPRTD